MQIAFHGADLGVTGSCHLVSCAGKRILIDCGLFQGERDVVEENRKPFGFDPASIDFLLLTHAHLDHCGRIPLLVEEGFRGEIITTAATRELTRLILLDAAHLQEEEAKWLTRRANRRGQKGKKVEPLFTMLDALSTMDCFGRMVDYGQSLTLATGIDVTFLDAGHILGSASILLQLNEATRHRRLLFSGDLGYSERVILRNPAKPPHADVVVMETTYADRLHKPLQPSIEELYETINATFKRGGNVIIPSFALERSQEILYYLREGRADNRLPAFMQVFLDSPMAISATEIFKRHPECFDAEMRDLLNSGHDPFGFPGLHFTRQTSESIALNRISGGAIIIAGSGMCTGGRVRHHLQHHLWRADCSVAFVGFAARGTPARRIIDGAKSVRIFGEDIPVRAAIHTIGGFSAHADRDDLLRWHEGIDAPDRTYLVHGEVEIMQGFADELSNTEVVLPKLGAVFDL